jgi:endonuclease YncB( thermonuclease family)
MSRRVSRRSGPRSFKGWTVVLVLLLIVTGVAGLPYLVASDEARRPPADPQLTRLALPPGYSLESLERATVEDIIDGDTIDVRLRGQTVRVRYFGVDTPERGQRCYREATDRNELLLEGNTVLLLPDARTEDRFGRLLRYVFLEDGTSIDATLVAEGFGRAWRDDGRYRDEIVRLEQEAESAGRGCLW